MQSLTSKSDIGLYDPNLKAYKFALAFNDQNMVHPVSGMYELRFASVWGDSLVPFKCGKVKIDFGLEISVPLKVSDGKMLPEIDFVNPEQPTPLESYLIWLYIICVLLVIGPFLARLPVGNVITSHWVSITLLGTSLLFIGSLLGSHYLDSVFEALPFLLGLLIIQAFTYHTMLKRIKD